MPRMMFTAGVCCFASTLSACDRLSELPRPNLYATGGQVMYQLTIAAGRAQVLRAEAVLRAGVSLRAQKLL